jgi:hypothetical protein
VNYQAVRANPPAKLDLCFHDVRNQVTALIEGEVHPHVAMHGVSQFEISQKRNQIF